MSLELCCIPTKQLFYDSISGYKVLSCKPKGYYKDLQLNKYNNFTLSGNNLENLEIGEDTNLSIELDTKSKYPCSYVLIGYVGMEVKADKIVVNPQYELEILSRYMEKRQAVNVNKAYPNFVELVLNNQEDEIDYHKIKNVANKRLTSYVEKLKKDCKNILFFPSAIELGISDNDMIFRLSANFGSPDEMLKSYKTNPYYIYIDLLGMSFTKADELVMTRLPEFIDSKTRCEYACLEILSVNESSGDTRLNANVLASQLKVLAPETRQHIIETVTNNSKIHYDNTTKNVSLERTYKAEENIANHILERLSNDSGYRMNWQKYQNIDNTNYTDEQMEILKIVGSGSKIGILTGSAGCGKTTSVKALLKMLEDNGKGYTLLAPTGIASKRLSESTGKHTSTIHMFLACGGKAEEYIIIDEFSIVGVHLLSQLLEHIGTMPNLIFVCDNAQLASISCGNIIQDLLDANIIPRANLTKVFRYNSSGLATMATDARTGEMKHLHDKYDDFKFLPIDNALEQVIDAYSEMLSKGYKKDEMLILSPYNTGNKGTYIINNAIQEKFNSNEFTPISYKRQKMGEIKFKVGDRVLNTVNNYNMTCLDYNENGEEIFSSFSCMNGDCGTIREYRVVDNKPSLIVEFDNGLGVVQGKDIGNLLLGYSISTHRIQGSESKAVIILVDKEHKRLLSNNLLYVALSRAREIMTLIGDENVINEALKVRENMERDTNLGDMLMEGSNV